MLGYFVSGKALAKQVDRLGTVSHIHVGLRRHGTDIGERPRHDGSNREITRRHGNTHLTSGGIASDD